MAERLGFVGVGRMGGPMAKRLIAAGYDVTVYDRSEAALRPLVEAGAKAARSVAEVASAAETVLVSLPTPDIVREVALGPDGIVAGNQVRTLIDLSTTGPRVAAAVAAGLKDREIAWVDAPVSGGVNGAVKGTLAVMVSCERRLFVRLEPVLKNIGKVFFIGEQPGMGQTMKLINNMLSAAAMAVSCEGIVMGAKAGLDPAVMIDVISAGSGMNTATRDKFPKSILPRTFDFGFATGLMYKDVKLCMDEADALGVPMWVANAARQVWSVANTQLGADSDFTSVIKCVEQWAGIEVPAKK
jgi:3-hydroxyisobutyrate dehydrogenase-like beta-hydroxyacid dehydrogenase